MATNIVDRQSRIYAIRVPTRLQRQLEAIAARDSNGMSSTIRRLIAIGLRAEDEQRRREAHDA